MIEFIDFTSEMVDGVEQCRRLFHGRGRAYKGLEHINVDWLPPVVLITVYKETDEAWLRNAAQQLKEKITECRSVQVQYRCRPMAPYELLWGEEINNMIADENGLKYHIQLGHAQNSGLFLDMRNGRSWVKENARDKKVLNLFAYTCAFSVAALAGGASHVVNVDMSKSALSRGRENHRLNQQNTKQVTFWGVDIFKSFSKIRKQAPYDLLICDPPAFQKGSVDIKRDYKKLVRRIPEMMNPGALIMLCLNSPELDDSFIHEMVASECPDCRFKEQVSPPEVFKESMAGRGLKVFIYQYKS